LQVFHTTIAGNIADSGAIGGGTGGGIYRAASSTFHNIWNSLLAENYAGRVSNDCAGAALTSQDYNYIQTIAGCALAGSIGHNVTGGDARLDRLQDNGGVTPTRALLAGSPALERIPPALCRDDLGVAPIPDQRGATRPFGPLCDIGAFEGSKGVPLLGRNL